MDLSDLIPNMPADFWRAVRRLGRWDWFSFRRGEGMRTDFDLRMEALAGVPDAKKLVDRFRRTEGISGLVFCWLECLGKMAAFGPKLFRPTAEQCEAMEHVDIRLGMAEYRQPYPAMAIQFPEEYRRGLLRRIGGGADGLQALPQYTLLRWWSKPNPAFFSGLPAPLAATGQEISYFFQARPELVTIEDALRNHVSQTAEDSLVSEAMTRVAMNLCLMLVHHGCTESPSNPQHLERLARRSCDDARRQERSHVYLLSLEQEVTVREIRSASASLGGTHASPKPHWRRGHWRRQSHGVGRSEKRMVFIRPTFVRASSFVGQLGDISVAYRGGTT